MSVKPDDVPDTRPELLQKIKILEAIRRGQEPIWDDPKRGLTFDPAKDEIFSTIQTQSIQSNTPLSMIVDGSSYSLEILKRSLITLVYEVSELGLVSELDPMNLVKQLDMVLPELVSNALTDNPDYFGSLSKNLGVCHVVSSLIGSSLIQPSMIHLALHSQREYLDAWELTRCPVCGRLPSVVLKTDEEVWRFKCTYCRAEYKMDIFTCPHCGSTGSEKKEFLLVGESQEFEVASCLECGRYYKIINRAKLEQPIPEGLEDLYTELLDEVAHERGMARLDEIAIVS